MILLISGGRSRIEYNFKTPYRVHPVATEPSTKEAKTKNNNAGGSNQNDILFNLGYAISGAPINIGTK